MPDLSKLAPAPWAVKADHEHGGLFVASLEGFPILLPESDGPDGLAALELAALARNAFAGDPEALAWWEANRVKHVEGGASA